jgi:hypothetical protein
VFLDIFADFRAGVVWFSRVGSGPLPLSVGLENKDERMVKEKKKRDHLCLVGWVVWIELLGDGEQMLDVESPDFLAGRGEGWGGHGVIDGLTDCVEEKTEIV